MTSLFKHFRAAILSAALVAGFGINGAMAHESEHDHEHAEMTIIKKNITIETPWARASASKHAAAGFMHITSNGTDDLLLEARSDLGKKTEIHLSQMDDDGVMHMIKQNSLPLPAGKTMVLKPGGFHIMFMKLHDFLRKGDEVEIELVFEKAGIVKVKMPVKKPGHKMKHGHDHH